jgi:hypothetical protein
MTRLGEASDMRAALVPLGLVCCLAPLTARAEESARGRFEVGGSLGYAFPLGSAEIGSELRDTTQGIPTFALDASVRLIGSVGASLRGHFGIGIPTLCASPDACAGSLGTDIGFALGPRFELPRVGPVHPHATLGVGYEWFAARLKSGEVSASRSYDGPTIVACELAAPFRLSRRWSFGPSGGFDVGSFTNAEVRTPAGLADGIVSRALHGRVWVALRLVAAPDS